MYVLQRKYRSFLLSQTPFESWLLINVLRNIIRPSCTAASDSANKILMDLNCFSCKLDQNREKLHSFQIEGEWVKRNDHLYILKKLWVSSWNNVTHYRSVNKPEVFSTCSISTQDLPKDPPNCFFVANFHQGKYPIFMWLCKYWQALPLKAVWFTTCANDSLF